MRFTEEQVKEHQTWVNAQEEAGKAVGRKRKRRHDIGKHKSNNQDNGEDEKVMASELEDDSEDELEADAQHTHQKASREGIAGKGKSSSGREKRGCPRKKGAHTEHSDEE